MKNKEFSEKAIRHGERMIVPIDQLPEGAKEVYTGNKYIVGHSETGHHHVLIAPEFKVYELQGKTYLEVLKEGELQHQKTFDKHATVKVLPGFYQINVKNNFNYFIKKSIQVRD